MCAVVDVQCVVCSVYVQYKCGCMGRDRYLEKHTRVASASDGKGEVTKF